MQTKKQYKVKVIHIPSVGQVFRFKSHLIELGLKYNGSKQYYSNENELQEKDLEEIIWICDKNDFKYEIKEEIYTDNNRRTKNIYKLISIDENNFYIQNRQSNSKVLIISIYQSLDKDIINILDCSHGKYFNLNTKFPDYVKNKLLETYNMLVLKENELDVDFDVKNLIYVLSILLEEYNKDKSKKAKIIKFKNIVISEIEKKSKDGFLCNGIRGFYPETEFYLRNRRIISSYTKNPLSFQQEMKVWSILSYPENKKFIGVRRNLSLFEQFYGSKIKVSVDSFDTKVNITKIKQEGSLLLVQVFNGNSHAWIQKRFTKDELFNMVKEAR